MNNEHRKGLSGLAAGTVFFGVIFWGGVGSAAAADCKAMLDEIVKEHTLMTRRTMIEDAMRACPRDAEIVYQYGYTLERLRKYEDALRSYKKAIALEAGYAKAYFSIGDIQMIMKNLGDAKELIQTVMGELKSS